MKGAELLTPKQRVFAEYFVSHYPKGTKKEAALLRRQFTKLNQNLGGLTTMNQVPDIAIVVDPKREATAVAECWRWSGWQAQLAELCFAASCHEALQRRRAAHQRPC